MVGLFEHPSSDLEQLGNGGSVRRTLTGHLLYRLLHLIVEDGCAKGVIINQREELIEDDSKSIDVAFGSVRIVITFAQHEGGDFGSNVSRSPNFQSGVISVLQCKSVVCQNGGIFIEQEDIV